MKTLVALFMSTIAAFSAGCFYTESKATQETSELRKQRDFALQSAHTALAIGERALKLSDENMQSLALCLSHIGVHQTTAEPDLAYFTSEER